MTESPDDIVGHKTFDTGERDPETGFPLLRHEPLTRAEGEELWAHAKHKEAERAERMPNEVDCYYQGEWPNGHYMLMDEHDCYPTSTVAMYRLYPEDEAKEKERWKQAAERYKASTAGIGARDELERGKRLRATFRA